MKFEIKSCLDDLCDDNYISKDDFKFLKPCGSKPGVMYGLCKAHKGTTDLRSMNILSKILFQFLKKSLIKIQFFF